MHILTRFFSQKKFLDAFISGKLYMNTLNYFWNNGFEEQKDIFEGVVCTVPVKDFNGFPMDFQAAQASDYHFRAEGYKFCNVLCFYKINFLCNFLYNRKVSMTFLLYKKLQSLAL